MRKLFSLLIAMMIFAFSLTIFADVGKSNTESASPTKTVAALAPFTQAVIEVYSVAESRRIREPLIPEISLLNFEANPGSITKSTIFDNSIYHLPPKRVSLKRNKANIRSPDAERTE